MKNRVWLAIVVLSAIGGTAYLVSRERAFREQRSHGFRASSNTSEDHLYSHTVFAVGDLFLTFDSTESASALWMVRPQESLASWLHPPPVRPLEYAKLIQWKAPGRVVWSLTGKASADLLIEFAPETNHRLAVVRVNCTDGSCRTTAQERGLPEAKLVVNAEGRAVLLGEKSFVVYRSIADLMRDSGTTTPRLSSRNPSELLAQSSTATLLISNTSRLTGEIIEEKSHGRIALSIDDQGKAAGLALNDKLQLVIDDNDERERTRLWDCPLSVLDGSSECTVYTSPDAFPRSGIVSMTDDECGIGVHRDDWTWLVRRNARTQELLPATGIVQCRDGEILTYKARHVDYSVPENAITASERRILRVQREPEH